MANERLKIVDLSGGPRATIELLQALRRNEIVAIQGDRVYRRHGADVPFFSQPATFPLGPFLLSQVSGAPVLPGFVIRQGWLRYRVLLGDPILPVRLRRPRSRPTGRFAPRRSGFWKKRWRPITISG
jgi:lauroyl/myristoyl acyltransferase